MQISQPAQLVSKSRVSDKDKQLFINLLIAITFVSTIRRKLVRKLWVDDSSFRYFVKHFCIYIPTHNLFGVDDFSSEELHCNYRLWIQEADEVPEILRCLMCCDEIACYRRIPVLFHDTISFLNRVFIFSLLTKPISVVYLMILASEKKSSSGFFY